MIYFRQVFEPRVSSTDKNMQCWQVECYEDPPENAPYSGLAFPVGVAYVSAIAGLGAQLDFILVADQWRREGYGLQLMNAVKERWTGLTSSPAMGGDGAGLLKAAGLLSEED